MAAVSLDSYRVKDLTEWSPVDVQQFFQAILPGHPCADFFTYTSGYVLCSMDKVDLRRQARDEEAANVIWAELKGCKRTPAPAPRGAFQARQTFESGVEGPPTVTVYVRSRQEVAMEFEVLPSDSVGSLKTQVAEREGTAIENQRLILNGMNMADGRTLVSYDVRRGAVILLVPQLRDQGRTRQATFAPRGVLMTPGSKVWTPAHPVRPYMPVLSSDVSRGFPVSMEFASTADSEAFSAAAIEEPPVLCVQPPPGSHMLPIETRVYLDSDTEGVRLGPTTGSALLPNSRYEAFVHFGGRGGELRVTLVTGAAVV